MTLIPNNRKIDAEGSRQVKGIDTGGGDVTLAGPNPFTGPNSFTTPPTSAQDADSANELVRFSQLSGLGGGVESVTGNLVDNTDPDNPVVTGVETVTGTAVDNTDPRNPVISVDEWENEVLIDTILLTDSDSNVTYACNSRITIYNNKKIKIKRLHLSITNIISTGAPAGGYFQIKGFNFYNFIGANRLTCHIELYELYRTSYSELEVALAVPSALGTLDGELVFRKKSFTTRYLPFTNDSPGASIGLVISCYPDPIVY